MFRKLALSIAFGVLVIGGFAWESRAASASATCKKQTCKPQKTTCLSTFQGEFKAASAGCKGAKSDGIGECKEAKAEGLANCAGDTECKKVVVGTFKDCKKAVTETFKQCKSNAKEIFTKSKEACKAGFTTCSGCCETVPTGSGCSIVNCGDGVAVVGEDCDDAGESATCDADCTSAECGDGTKNATAAEECDGNDDLACPGACGGDCVCLPATTTTLAPTTTTTEPEATTTTSLAPTTTTSEPPATTTTTTLTPSTTTTEPAISTTTTSAPPTTTTLVPPPTTTTTTAPTTTTASTPTTTTTTLMRFVDNGDGTITDIQTRLMWEKKSDDFSVHDVDSVFTWSADPFGTEPNGSVFTIFLATLNAGSGFAGYKDWRLPEIDHDGGAAELESLVDLSRQEAPYVHDAFNTSCTGFCNVLKCSCTERFLYWSSVTWLYPPRDEDVWTVNFGDGYVVPDGKDSALHVRAVRGGSVSTTTTTSIQGSTTTTTLPRFEDNGDGTITDYETGLMWEKKSNDGSIHDVDNLHSWSQPPVSTERDGDLYTVFLATLNAGSGFAGYKDWRLPEVDRDGGVEELDSLVDLSQEGEPYIFDEFNSGCTPGCTVLTCSCTWGYFHWSATTWGFPTRPEDAWTVNFGDGYVVPDGKEFPYPVRAVRDAF